MARGVLEGRQQLNVIQAGDERRRKVERDWRGEFAGAFVTNDPGSRAKTVGSNCGAAGPAAAFSHRKSNKWLYGMS